ncbi:MAG: DUF167 domain-containing protein [Candidatus Veblenbacteria bacterium]|nr:DUF167 domain-containing protein [Candidatus Veblenbacteria bacterium]
MCRIKVRVTANSHHPGLVALVDKVLHLKVSAPPVDNLANRELCERLAEVLHVAPSLIAVRYGHMARVKTVEVQEVDENKVFAMLRQHFSVQEQSSA